jgi:hypothetical protein
LRIDRRGDWFYRGSRIDRLELVRLFASVLRRGPDGGYWLVTPAEQGRVEVEDVPFTAVALESEGDGEGRSVRFRINLGDWLTADADHPLTMRETGAGSAPYLGVGRGLEARLLPAVYYELVELAGPAPARPRELGVWSAGVFFALGEVAEA